MMLVKRGLLVTAERGARVIEVVGADWSPPRRCPQCDVDHFWTSNEDNEWLDIATESVDANE